MKTDKTVKEKEVAIQNKIRIELSKLGVLTFRNNTGWASQERTKYGLCNGSSDIIGILPDGRFLAIEVKTTGKKPTIKQLNFIRAVCNHNGVAFHTDSVAHCIAVILDQIRKVK